MRKSLVARAASLPPSWRRDGRRRFRRRGLCSGARSDQLRGEHARGADLDDQQRHHQRPTRQRS